MDKDEPQLIFPSSSQLIFPPKMQPIMQITHQNPEFMEPDAWKKNYYTVSTFKTPPTKIYHN